jgi:hypothetical protein
MGQLDEAAKAHRAAQAGLEAAKAKARQMVRAARERADETREALAEAIVAEALEGVTQVEIIRRSGYARETVRTILRRGGIEAD